jgi:hypothetical protein
MLKWLNVIRCKENNILGPKSIWSAVLKKQKCASNIHFFSKKIYVVVGFGKWHYVYSLTDSRAGFEWYMQMLS